MTGTGGPSGEWLDHVVDAVRTPLIHISVVVAVWRHDDAPLWVAAIGLAFAALSSGQFISQILAEQLQRARGVASVPESGGLLKSFVLLPNDMGTLCWLFVLWGFAPFSRSRMPHFSLSTLCTPWSQCVVSFWRCAPPRHLRTRGSRTSASRGWLVLSGLLRSERLAVAAVLRIRALLTLNLG